MKRTLKPAFCFVAAIIMGTQLWAGPDVKNAPQQKAPLSFIENKGQVRDQDRNARPDIQFQLKAAGGLSIFIGDGAIHYQFSKDNNPGSQPSMEDIRKNHAQPVATNFTMYRMDVELAGANKNAQIITEQKQDYNEHYFTDWSGEKGTTAYTYNRITYKNIYPNIDWVLYTKDGQLEHEFAVHQGGKVSDIKLKYGGAKHLKIIADGSLSAVTPQGTITEQAPNCYQADGKKVNSAFVLNGANITYSLGEYAGDLIIDPTLGWATYYGGSGSEQGRGVATDVSGNVYMGGLTASASAIATSGAYQTTYAGGTNDAFLAKFNSSGAIQWATYYGGTGDDEAWGVATDGSGNVFITGQTASASGIATSAAHQTTFGGTTEAFLAKFNSSGAIQWATYYGGGSDQGSGVATDGAGNVYITGYTASTSAIATSGAYQTAYGGGTNDAFLAKFNSSGAIQWGTYYGGSLDDEANGIASDGSGNVFIAGQAQSASAIATSGAYQTLYGGLEDAFLAKFNSSGAIQWATYYGGNNGDYAWAVATDGSGNSYITGETGSTSGIATSGAYQTSNGGGFFDVFLAKFNGSGAIQWATYYGGTGGDLAFGVAADGSGNVYFTGQTASPSSIATSGAYHTVFGGGYDAYFTQFSGSGTLLYGTYFGGGAGSNIGSAIATDGSGNAYFTGFTGNPSGVATSGAYQTAFGGGGQDAFLAQFSNPCSAPPVVSSVTPALGFPVSSVTITGTGFNSAAASDVVYFGATKATVSAATNTSLTLTVPAEATFSPVTVNNLTCNLSAYSPKPFEPTFNNTGYITAVASFDPMVDFATGVHNGYVVTIGDIDGDGKADIITTDQGFSVFRNTATSGSIASGSFSRTDFTTSVPQPFGVAVGDIDGDGKLDVVVANQSANSVTVFRNTSSTGSISFAAGIDLSVGNGAQYIAINDIDGDGKPDIVVSNNSDNTVSVLRNTSSAGAVGFAAGITLITAAGPSGVTMGDIDGDGKPEIVVGCFGGNAVSIFRNIASPGTITSGSFATRVDVTGDVHPFVVSIGDIDGDGKPDIAASDNGGGVVSVFRSTSSVGSLSFAARVDISAGSGPSGLALGDINGDGKVDMAVSNQSSNTVSVFLNTSTSGSVSFTPQATFATDINPYGLAMGDLDGDGKPDLAVPNAGTTQLSVLRNDALVAPPTITSLSPELGVPGSAVTITGTNFNTTAGNNIVYFGATRAVVTSATSTSMSVTVPLSATYQDVSEDNTALSLTGYSLYPFVPTFNGCTSAAPVFNAQVAFPTAVSPYGVAFGDLDGDGKPDMVVCNSTSNSISIYRNISVSGTITTGSFATAVTFATATSPRSVAIGDLDGDGKPEIVVTNAGSGSIYVFRNTAVAGTINSGSFATAVQYTTTGGSNCVAIGDLDGDGKPDIALANGASSSISVLRNTSSPGGFDASSFAAIVNYIAPSFPQYIVIADIDGDGKPDLATANGSALSASVYRNTSTPGIINGTSFGPRVDFTTGTAPCIALSDIDGDGKPDMLVINSSSSTVSVFRNTAISGVINSSSFATNVDFTTGSTPVWLSMGDINGDGKPDLVTCNQTSGNVSVLRNTASSGIINSSSLAPKVDFAVSTGPRSIVVGDIDGDGMPDLMVVNNATNSVSVLRNNLSISGSGPAAPVTGPSVVCPGNTITLTDITGGGTWSSANPAVGTVSSSGVVTGISVGNVLISYSEGGSCGTTAMALITVGNPNITTFAGTGVTGSGVDGGLATATAMTTPIHTVMDAAGNIYYSDYLNNRIRKISTAGIVTTVAGNGFAGYTGDGFAATNASIYNPAGNAIDAAGNLYITDYQGYEIRKVNTAGIISTIAGTGTAYLGTPIDGIPATASGINHCWGVTVDGSGNVYFSDRYNHNIRKINTSGIISTVAGTGTAGYSGDGGPATAARMYEPLDLIFDVAGNLLVTEGVNAVVRKIAPDGTISTIAGSGVTGFGGDGGPATAATVKFSTPVGIALDAAGNIYIGDYGNARVRKINTSGVISTVAGSGTAGYNFDNVDPTVARLNTPQGVAIYGTGDLYICDANNFRIRKVSPVNATVAAISGTAALCQGVSSGFTDATAGGIWSSSNSAIASVGSLTGVVNSVAVGTATISYSVTYSCGTMIAIMPVTVSAFNAGVISGPSTVCPGNTITLTDAAGSGAWSSSNPAAATVVGGVVTGVAGGYTVISYTISNSCGTLAARQMITVGSPVITTIAGTGTPGSLGDGAAATAAQIQGPSGAVMDAAGNIYFSDYNNNRIRKITAAGIISTVAGTGVAGYLGDGTSAVTARIQTPSGIAIDPSGNILWAEYLNHVIRKLTVSSGIISTVAGNGTGAFFGDNGPATGARLNHPPNVMVDATGVIYIPDAGNQRIRKIDLSGNINTIAGTGTSGYNGDGIAATTARVADPFGLALDAAGNLYIADQTNHRVRKIDQFGIISTILGTGTPGSSADGVPATGANVNQPTGVNVDAAGNIDVVDRTNNCVRQINSQTGLITTLVNSSLIAGYSGDGGAPATAELNNVPLIYLDASSNMYISDFANNRLRKVAPVNNTVAAVSGATTLCVGATTPYTDVTTGGKWTSSSPGVAGVGSSTGIVTGLTPGVTTITYSETFACGTLSSSQVLTVNPLPGVPAAITGTTTICNGSSVTLNDVTAGGVWTSSVSTVASVPTGAGNVTGVSVGSATISYTISNSCGANVASVNVTVVAAPVPIAGTLNVCVGSTTLLSDGGGGNWTSSAPATASIGALTGLVTGNLPGNATITYTLSGICTATAIVTVNPSPAAITPPATVTMCVGATASLDDVTPGGTWSSAVPGIATVGTSGIVTGLASGPVDILYTLAAGCQSVKTVTVLVTPTTLSPTSSIVCTGTTVSFSDGVGGGTWSSTSPGVASVVGGVVTGNTVGTANISYTIGTCAVGAPVTVNLSPDAGTIAGPAILCTGTPVTYTDAAGGGTWSSSNPAIATIGSTGLATGIAPGTVTLSYAITNSCGTAAATMVVTVSNSASAGTIIGSSTVCAGTFTTLVDVTPGGTWSASNSDATISAGGLMVGITPGTDTISYTVTNTCGTATTTKIITVGLYLSAGTISGPGNVCVGSTITLTDPSGGGVWSSSNADAAVTGGVITGLSGGLDTINYTVTASCGSATAMQVVNVVPVPTGGTITGPVIVCAGSVTTYTDATPGGTWGVTNAFGAITGGGIFTALTVGTDTITYTVTNMCGTAMAETAVSIGAAISAGSISGPGSVCAGSAITLSDPAPGGSWSVSNGHATIIVGILTGVSAGIDTVTYTVTGSCGSVSASATILINPLPVAGTITGPASLCLGATATYTDGTTGGIWGISNSDATITSSGLVTPVSAGTDTISYSVTNGCGTATATEIISIGTLPSAGTISGLANICIGTSVTLTDGIPGGTWSASNTNATVAGGLVTGVVSGLDTIGYTVTSSCGTATATKIVDVNLVPSPGTITGPSGVCIGTLITLSDTAIGGAWSASNPDATISIAGVVTGIAPGTDTISYTVTDACGSFATTYIISVSTTATAGSITGPSVVCAGGGTIALSDAIAGGIWASSNASATITTSGVVTGVTPGTDTITYVVTNSCGTATASDIITVGAALVAGTISGPSGVCVGSAITLTDPATGGTWSSSNTDATVAGGVVTGVTSGTDTIYYTVTGSCGSVSATKIISISLSPSAGTITGPTGVCAGSTITLTDGTPGGTWSASNTKATVAAGTVTGVLAGLDTVRYSVTNGCGTAVASWPISVNSAPSAGSISGSSSICPSASVTLTHSGSGGAWSSSNTSVATVSGTGTVTGISSGTVTISYTVTNTCGHSSATHPMTVLSPSSCLGLQASNVATGQGEQLIVAPNPNSGTFTMNLSSDIDEEVQVTITNVLGQKVKEFTTTTNKVVDIQLGEAAGIYLLNASTTNGRHVAKVIIN